jgi:hypothetical protein
MRFARRLASLVALLPAFAGVLSAGCSSSSGGAGGAGEVDAGAADADDPYAAVGGDEVIHTYAPTFTAVYDEIIAQDCALVFCHGGGDDFLSMGTQAIAYKAMVGVVSHGPMCGDSGLTIVVPDDPTDSLLYQKITNPPCGGKMPAQYGIVLSQMEIDQIKDWIAMGAKND